MSVVNTSSSERRRRPSDLTRAFAVATAATTASNSSSSVAPDTEREKSNRLTIRPRPTSCRSTASIEPGRSARSINSTSTPPSAPARSVIEPCATRRPASSATTWSQIRSTSSSTCDDSITSIPNVRLTSTMMPSISSRCTGSRPSVGSSRTIRLGSAAIACASLTRWR
jgi:hypothetical protein